MSASSPIINALQLVIVHQKGDIMDIGYTKWRRRSIKCFGAMVKHREFLNDTNVNVVSVKTMKHIIY
jgi:hypothetical protein